MKEKLVKLFEFFDDDTPYYAASLSFFTIFSILPLIALLIAIVSTLPAFSSHLDLMMLYILDFINPTHSEILSKSISGFLANTNDLGSIGTFYLVFVFTLFFKDYEYIINKIYGTKSRALYKLFFMYLSFMIIIPVLFIAFVLVSTISNVTFFGQITMFVFIWIFFIILFMLSANTKIRFTAAAFSSLVTLVTLSVTKNLFEYYVIYNKAYSTIYGSFSAALFFFLWIYISWNIYLYGTKLCSIINQGNIKNEN